MKPNSKKLRTRPSTQVHDKTKRIYEIMNPSGDESRRNKTTLNRMYKLAETTRKIGARTQKAQLFSGIHVTVLHPADTKNSILKRC